MSPETVGFDTSGAIRLVPARSDPDGPIYRWSDLSPFVQGYIRAAFESLLDGFSHHERATELAGFSDLHPDTLATMLADCARFQSLDWVFQHPKLYDNAQGGSTFWTVRQRGDWRDKGFPPLRLSLDQNGKVVATPETKHEGE